MEWILGEQCAARTYTTVFYGDYVSLDNPGVKVNHSIVKDEYQLTEGCFHSFIQKKDAEKMCNDLIDCYMLGPSRTFTFVVAECIIPKGSFYYTGYEDNGRPCFASKWLKVVNIF